MPKQKPTLTYFTEPRTTGTRTRYYVWYLTPYVAMQTLFDICDNQEQADTAIEQHKRGEHPTQYEPPTKGITTMSKTQHTPGPWKQIIAQPGAMLEIVNDEREYVCSLLGGDEYKKGNARLITQAPAMLGTLEVCLIMAELQEKRHGYTIENAKIAENIRSAIEQIKGV